MPGKFPLHRFGVIGLLIILTSVLFASGAAALPCNPETSVWVPEQSYTQGSVIYYNDHWYEARSFNIGGEPGVTFHWRALNDVPDCDRKATEKREENAPKIAAPGSGTNRQPAAVNPGSTSESTRELCITPEPWRFVHQYSADELVTHGSKVWQAIHPTKGDMPGTVQPPSWQLVPDHCSMKLNSSFGN